MSDGIEKLKELADQIEREHEEELHELKKRYKTDLQNARESRDIAIKEASKLRNDVNLAKDLVHDFRSDIAIMLGISCDGMVDEVQEAIEAELYNRLMPEGMEWPRFEAGEKVKYGDYIMHDGKSERVQGIYLYDSTITLSLVGVDHEKLHTVEYGERVKRPVTEVLGADGKPIEVAHTKPDTQERTCQMKKARWDDGQCTWGVICSACCDKHEHSFEYSFNFCPTCGAKVVEE